MRKEAQQMYDDFVHVALVQSYFASDFSSL